MSLLDVFTGGKSDSATDALKRAEDYFTNIKNPTAEQLTLPQLQQYIEAGVMTPAEAQAYLQQSNEYNDENIDQTGTRAQVEALNRLSAVADAGAEGTPAQQAAMDAAEQNMNRVTGGQRGAIEQAMAARGTPYALIQGALEGQAVGQDAQQAHMDAVNAQAQAYQTALNAMAQGGALGGQLQGQQNTQANTVAAAQNAMQQFNAQNQQNVSMANAGRQQEANAMNSANKQQVSNNNVGNANARIQYNANVPQQMFNNDVTKAQGMAGAASNIGNLYQNQGKQNAGIAAGLINTATSFIPKPPGASSQGGMSSMPTDDQWSNVMGAGGAGNRYAHGGIVDHDHSVCMAHGGICMADGGEVPGEALFPGDTTMNDTVHAELSPGEAVIPRSTVQENPDAVMSLLGNDQTEVIDPTDVATLLKALRAIRTGAA